ncbi:MAG: hypothetical protein R8G66_13705 [Cytophagales bacterium]|nr:hypothetical protein [Cytophagales bacterium]
MTKRLTYRIHEDEEERELIYEETRDEADNLIAYINYDAPERTEGYYEYDEQGNMILEREVVDGVEASKMVFEYDEKGNLIHTKQFVADEIFEEVIHEYTEQGVTMQKMRFGDEIERRNEVKDGNDSVREIYDEGELLQRQKAKFDPETRTYEVAIEDSNGNPVSTMIRIENEAGELIKEEIKNLKGQVLSNREYQYDGELMTYEKQENFLKGYHFEVINEYNDDKQMISTETRSLAGQIIEFETTEYNEEGKAIAARGVTRLGESYQLEYEYE